MMRNYRQKYSCFRICAGMITFLRQKINVYDHETNMYKAYAKDNEHTESLLMNNNL
jgi:hypothetical protein